MMFCDELQTLRTRFEIAQDVGARFGRATFAPSLGLGLEITSVGDPVSLVPSMLRESSLGASLVRAGSWSGVRGVGGGW